MSTIHSAGHPASRWSVFAPARRARRATTTVYQITDLLHAGRTVRVSGSQITATVSEWLAELGAHSPLVEDLSRSVAAGDWPTTRAISDLLSVDVAVAA